MKIMHRAAMDEGTFAATALGDPTKRKLAAGLLGQAFVIAYETIKLNKDATERIAERLIAEGEMYGDDVTQMLDEAAPAQARNRRPGRVLMARDLIPPPSPAGRPTTPDGTPNLIELPPEPRALGRRAGDAAPPPGPSQFRNRFGFLLGALAGVFIAVALVAAIVIANQQRRRRRRRGPGGQLVALAADGHDARGRRGGDRREGRRRVHAPGRQAARRRSRATQLPVDDPRRRCARPAGRSPHRRHRASSTTLNGLGDNGSIKGGTPSETRLKVIQREALELALYTFRYLPDAESVTVLLPPPPPTDASRRPPRAASAAARRASRPTPRRDRRRCSTARATSSQQLQMPLGRRSGRRRRARTRFTRAGGASPSTTLDGCRNAVHHDVQPTARAGHPARSAPIIRPARPACVRAARTSASSRTPAGRSSRCASAGSPASPGTPSIRGCRCCAARGSNRR